MNKTSIAVECQRLARVIERLSRSRRQDEAPYSPAQADGPSSQTRLEQLLSSLDLSRVEVVPLPPPRVSRVFERGQWWTHFDYSGEA